MSDPYILQNWYFTATNRSSLVYSAPAEAWVADTDATYLAWVADGNAAINYVTDGVLALELAGQSGNQLPGTSLSQTLANIVLAVDPTSVPSSTALLRLAVYQTVLYAGVVLTSTGTAGSDGTYELSGPSFSRMQQLLQYTTAFTAFPNAAGSLIFVARSGNITFASVDDFNAAIQGLLDYANGWLVWVQAGGSAPTWGAITIT